METIDFHMCGERGLISSFFLDLSKKPISSLMDFLSNAIESNKQLNLDTDGIEKVAIIIEPDFGKKGFGSPDAIIALRYTTGERKVFIIEAKRTSFEKSCSNKNRTDKGYNSTLKGQLELNYCLSLSLSNFKQSDNILVEPDWIKKTPYYEERKSKPSLKEEMRYLKKSNIINDIVFELSGMTMDNYYHIVITKENDNPLKGDKQYHPEIYTEQHYSENQWNKINNQFGWINYEKMKKYFESSSESLFLKNIGRMSSFICWMFVVFMFTVNAYSQDIRQDEKELYEKHKNTLGFYLFCGSPSNLENQQSDFIYYLQHLNNLKNLNLDFRKWIKEAEINNNDEFFTENEMSSLIIDLSKRISQINLSMFQEDIEDFNMFDEIKSTQTYRLIKNLTDSLFIPVYESPVYYCNAKYVPSPSIANKTDVLIDKLSFVASCSPSKFKSSYLAQIKALQSPKTTEVAVSLTQDEEAKLTKLRSLISIYENEWGFAIFNYEKLHLLAKEYGHDIPLKVCKYYTDFLIKLFKVDSETMLAELNSKVTKIINGKMPIIRWGL